MSLCEPAKELARRINTTALDQSALLELLDELRTTDSTEVMRRLLTAMLKELIYAEATAMIRADRQERSESRTTMRNGTPFAAFDLTWGPQHSAAKRPSATRWLTISVDATAVGLSPVSSHPA